MLHTPPDPGSVERSCSFQPTERWCV